MSVRKTFLKTMCVCVCFGKSIERANRLINESRSVSVWPKTKTLLKTMRVYDMSRVLRVELLCWLYPTLPQLPPTV